MIQLVLSAATTETDNPDLRDRAYVYWRLLSTDPEVRSQQCCFNYPCVSQMQVVGAGAHETHCHAPSA